jgi:ABC-2 type transport system permease protein
MIDGIRYALTGHAEGNLLAGVLTLLALNVIFWLLSYEMLRRGYRIKS